MTTDHVPEFVHGTDPHPRGGWLVVEFNNEDYYRDNVRVHIVAVREFFPVLDRDVHGGLIVGDGDRIVPLDDLLDEIKAETPYEHFTHCWCDRQPRMFAP